jgi:hypothetical protein
MTDNDSRVSLGEPFDTFEADLEERVVEAISARLATQDAVNLKKTKPEPKSVDLSPYVHFVRRQGGAGCWGYSMVAMWDIMNEMQCPFTPNLSMRIWMMMHRRRELWESGKGIRTPDGRFHKMIHPDDPTKASPGPEWGLFQSFGNTTEGCDPTQHHHPANWPDGGWSREGINEAANYRLKGEPQKITVSSKCFIRALARGQPIRLKVGGHFVAVVGYDKKTKRFKWLNSGGDKWGDGGYATYTFADVDAGTAGGTKIYSAEVIEIIPPRPVPAARIRIEHTDRANVHLWLGAENSPHPRTKIWPHGFNDNSRVLHFTVRLPPEFIWPPKPNNRLVLELYDAANYSKTGGVVKEFTAAFGGHVVKCAKLKAGGSIKFKPRRRLQLVIG